MRKKPISGIEKKRLIDEIEKKYASLREAMTRLGPPVNDDCPGEPTEDGRGFFRDYAAGSIYSIPNLGTFEVHGKIWERWNSLDRERGVLGYPTGDEQETGDGVGRFSDFEGGSIYYRDGIGAFEVCGPILELWRRLSAEAGRLGYPTAGETEVKRLSEGGRVSRFQHGSIYWDQKRGAYEVLEQPEPPSLDQEAGSWEKSVHNSKVVGIHAALLRGGSVLFFSHGNPTDSVGGIEVGSAVLDFLAPAVTQQELDPGVICSGHTFLRDGRLIACGSERDVRGLHALRQFDPADGESGKWQHLADLTEARWYPTCVEQPDGRVLIVFTVIIAAFGALTLFRYWDAVSRNRDLLIFGIWLFLFMIAGMFVQLPIRNYRAGYPLFTATLPVFPVLLPPVVFYVFWLTSGAFPQGPLILRLLRRSARRPPCGVGRGPVEPYRFIG